MVRWPIACTVLALAAFAAAQEVATAPVETAEVVILRMQALLPSDITIADPVARRAEHVPRLRQLLALAETFDRRWPSHPYRAHAKSMLLDALSILREAGDPAGSDQALEVAAQDLLAGPADRNDQAKAQYVLLGVRLHRLLTAPATQPASGPATATASAPADRTQQMAEIAEQYVRLAERYGKTDYAPVSLYAAVHVCLEIGRDARAVEVIDRLAAAHPKDPITLESLLILVRLHANAGRAEAALDAKRRVVAMFGDTQAARIYRADIARAECIGREFLLRFAGADGRRFNIRDFRGRAACVYFFASAVDDEQADAAAKDIGELRKALGEQSVVAAVGGDRRADGPKVVAALMARGVDLPLLLDDQAQVAEHYGVAIVPCAAIVDADGKLVDIVSGPGWIARAAECWTAATQPASTSAEGK